MARDPLLQQVLVGYVVEADELVAKCTRCVLTLESGGDGEAAKHYDELARGLHTLKGTGATLTLDDLSTMAHLMEDRLEPYKRAANGPIPHGLADVLLKGLDLYAREVRAQSAAEAPTDPDVGRLIAHLQALGESESAEAFELETTEDSSPAARGGSWRVNESNVRMLLNDIEGVRELRLRLAGHRAELDQLSAEFPQLRGRLKSLARGLDGDAGEAAVLVESLETAVRSICTVPMRVVLEPLHRTVRDLCRKLGKEARLSTVGAAISLDRTALESLRGPLVHLVRNAIDHGLELPTEREVAGKHREGALLIRVEQQGNWLFIEVSDDGRGLDLARLRQVASERKLLPHEQLEAMSDREAMQLIFMSGLSTRDEASTVSGRGVGMDVVLRDVRALGGTVEVHSTPGRGTRFHLAVPTEIGASSLLVARCGETRVGLPCFVVERALYLEENVMKRTSSGPRIEYAGALLPLYDLGSLLGLHSPLLAPDGSTVLVVHHRGDRVAVSVDEVLGDWDLVIRPLPAELKGIGAYQGAAALAHGEQLLVLRPEWLFERQQQTEAPTVGRDVQRHVLVIDDSVGARMMHRAILEAGGFAVNAVASAESAQQLLRTGPYDAVVCDVQMAGMDGTVFTRWVRTQEHLKTLPVILVTAQDDAAARERGMQEGATAFLTKQECAAGRLLTELTAALSRRSG